MDKPIVETKNVDYIYNHGTNKAVNDVTLSINQGEFIAVLGRNGSGKSTLSRLFNALLLPSNGDVIVLGMNTNKHENVWEIRKYTGMIFQNPDNQIVGTLVEEDVAFGLENIGLEPEKIRKRVDRALDTVKMKKYATHAPHLLSGGQKQKVAIAGVLAMRPKCIILDEATAMLDPIGRYEIMSVIKKLNQEENITIVHITHHMDEAVEFDRVIVMDNGSIVLDDNPGKVFSNVKLIRKLGLDVPQVTDVFNRLREKGHDVPRDILNTDSAVAAIKKLIEEKNKNASN